MPLTTTSTTEINESKKEALNKELTLRKEKNLSKKNISQ